MNKQEYLSELSKHLKKLPKQDYVDAMEYFTEYFDESDELGAKNLMEELGTPKEAAADLIHNLLQEKLDNTTYSSNKKESPQEAASKRKHILRIALLAIITSPITFVAAIIIFLWIFLCLLITGIVVVNLFAFGVAFALLGAIITIRGIVSIPFSVFGFFIISGSGLFLLGAGMLLFALSFYLSKWIVVYIGRLAQSLFERYRRKGRC